MPGIFLNEAIVTQTAKKVYNASKPVINKTVNGIKQVSPYVVNGLNKTGAFAVDHKDELERIYHIGTKFKNGGYDQDLSTIKHDLLSAPGNMVNGVKNAPENIANGVKNAANSAVTSVRGY